MKRTLVVLSFLFLFASEAYSQGGILNDSVLRADGKPAIGATVRVCTEAASGTPCSPTASIFSDKALTIAKTNPIPVDSAAAFTYYASPGFYKEEICLGASCVTRIVLVPSDANNFSASVQNNIRKCDSFVGADAGAKITACIADLPLTGGIADARGLEGAQVISSTITLNKPVSVLLGYTIITCSASPCFDFPDNGGADASSLIGVGRGTSTDGGTRIVAANNTITPLIRIQGTDTTNNATGILLRDFTLEGSSTLDLNTGLQAKWAQVVYVERIQFTTLGQAVNIDDSAHFQFVGGNFFDCGTGDTAATACVRIEGQSGPAEQFWFDRWLWEGDVTAGNNEQGMALYIGPSTSQVWLINSKLDYDSTNPDFRIITIDKAERISIGPGNRIEATSITTAAAVVDITGDSGNRATAVKVFDNVIGFSNTVTGLRLDWGNNNTVQGGQFRGGGSGTAVTITANHQAAVIGPFGMLSLDTPVSNSAPSGDVVTMFVDGNANTAWSIPEGVRLGTGTIPTAGLIRVPNNVAIIRAENNAGSAGHTLLSFDASDVIRLGLGSERTRLAGTLGVGVAAQATGVLLPNNEAYQMLDTGGAVVAVAIVDGSDVLRLGDDADLASIVLGRSTVPTAVGGALEYRDAPTLAASTTPSTTGGNVFLTNNTASITDFTGELNGQVIILLCGADTTTSLVDSTPLFLAGAFTCTADDTITLVSNGTVWFETSRSLN